MTRLAGKTALVTGGAQGIGRAICDLFAREGATVVMTDVQTEPQGLKSDRISYLRLDVANADDWSSVVKSVLATHWRLDILVNNAGIVHSYGPIHETRMDDYDKVIAVTQTGTFLGMREVIPLMKEQGSGAIVNISSIWGSVGAPGAAAYHAAKGAVRNMTKNAAITYARDNIRVNSVHPGIIYTPLIQGQTNELNDEIVAVTPMGRMGQPDEIAKGCLFLASDESSFVTGAELVIDGGYLAQ